MAGYTGFSCEEEYDHYMQAEAEAYAQQEAEEAEAECKEIINAMQFLVNKGVEPNHYKSFYEQNEKVDKFEPFK